MPATLEAPRDLSRPTRPLYLKHVPTSIWEQVHINAIRSGLRLNDYLVAVLAHTEPIPTRPMPFGAETDSPATSSPANESD